jgi:metal-responsive CopG/Arc/MetJ family transcriptional regulator
MAKVVNITMPEDLFEAIDRQAKLEDRPRSSIFREAVRIYLALKRREVTQGARRSGRLHASASKAEQILRDNVIALHKVAMARGVTEEDLLRLGEEVREELYREQYGPKR